MELQIHNIKTIDYNIIKRIYEKTKEVYYVKHIKITTDKGERINLTLFSDSEKSLKEVKNKKL